MSSPTIATNRPFTLSQRSFRNFSKILSGFYQVVDPIAGNEGVPQSPRHKRIHLGDDYSGGLHGGQGDVYSDSQTEATESVRGRDVHYGHVDRYPSVAKQIGNLRMEKGNVIRV